MKYLIALLLSAVPLLAQPVFSLQDDAFMPKANPLLQGLVGYWQLEESSGTRYDRSGNGNHLTSNNSVGQGTGKVGNCGTFTNSNNQYLSSTNIFESSSILSVFTWVKFSTANNNLAIAGRYDSVNNKRKWSLRAASTSWSGASGREFAVVVSSDGQTLTTNNSKIYWVTNAAINNGVWHQVGFTWDSGTLKLYQDGAEPQVVKHYDFAFTSLYNSTGGFAVGATSDSLLCWNGSIDELGVWNRALSSAEITRLYKSGLGTTYPRFSVNNATDFDWDSWQPLYDRPKPFPTLIALAARREPEPFLTICE